MGGMPLRGRVAALLVIVAGALALVLTATPGPAAAAGTTLTVIRDPVTVIRSGVSLPGASGDLVRSGESVRTGAGGHAALTFADGSTITLSPDTTVVVEEATVRSGSVTVRAFQTIGHTWSSVARLLAPGSRFEVRTPAATASVRGTAFEVEVAGDGAMRVRTAEGSVAVSNDRGTVVVPEGSESRAAPGEPPAPAAPLPPATRRTIEVGPLPVVVVDSAGRGCGYHEGKVVEQIPGCVVRDGAIEIQDLVRVGEYRLAVTEAVAPGTTVLERTVTAAGVASDEEIVLPAAEIGAPVHVAGTGAPLQITVPLVGTIPVQLPTSAPFVAATPGATATPDLDPRLTLPPLPFPSTPTPVPTLDASLATVAPTPTAALPTATLAVPTATLALPSATIALLTPTPTPEPTTESTPTPTPEPTSTPTPTPTPTPTTDPASAVSATAAADSVTVTWIASTTIGATYEIERSTDGASYQLVGSTDAATLTFTQTVGTGTHCYRVVSVANGIKSSPAEGNCVTVAPPAAPASASVAAIGSTITVTWLASTTLGATYEIERSTNDGAFQKVGATDTATLTFTETAGAGTHSYRVRAVTGSLQSGPTSAGSVLIL